MNTDWLKPSVASIVGVAGFAVIIVLLLVFLVATALLLRRRHD